MKKSDYQKYFAGKKITKQGFGVLGRGFGVVKFLLKCGAKVTVTDLKPESEFVEQIEEILKLEKTLKEKAQKVGGSFEGEVRFVFGKHQEKDFTECDFVIQASGVPKDDYFLNLARQNNLPVYQEVSLFAKIAKENFSNLKLIGITGTRGKTTTTMLVHALLIKTFGKNKVHLGGNIQGLSTLSLLPKIKEGDWVIMELDSWLLQGFGNLKISPNISIFTSFMPDHMNYYKNDMREYFLDKAQIFLHQKPEDLFITTSAVLKDLNVYLAKAKIPSKTIVLDVKKFSKKFKTHLLGHHNQVLIALVALLAKELKIGFAKFEQTLKKFKGVTGRLQLVKTYQGIKIYNDTCATTGEATVAGLAALEEILPKGKKIILICGGKDKNLSLTNLVHKLSNLQTQHKLKTILLNDQTTSGSKKLLQEGREVDLECLASLNLAVKQALAVAKKGDTILFSPAFASFGMFKNEYDRGEQFVKLIKKFTKN